MSGLTERWRGERSILHHDIGPRERTPRLALVADIHNNQDVNGMFVLSRLAAFLRDIEAGERPGLRLRERIVIVPTVGNSPDEPDAADSRRIGWARWAITEAVVALTRIAYYRVDIYPASLDIEEMPQLRLYAPNDDERASACLFGLPAVLERPLEPGDAPGLVRIWRLYGGENFSIHAGQAGSLQTRPCEVLFHALLAFLDRTGMISGLRLANDEEDLRYFGMQQMSAVLAEQSGIFSTRQAVGCWVQAGEELGRIYDGFTGSERAQVVAPVAGLLCSLRRQPLLRADDLVARILMPENAIQRRPARRSQGAK